MNDLSGQTFGNYRVGERLGGGGMGEVYRAEDASLQRTVALKFLPPEWSRDPHARQRFLREARAAAGLAHNHICTVHEIAETPDGRLFIVMAHYEGETLKKKIERGRIPVADAVALTIQVAEGLEHANEQGVIHRDIKPANVMVTDRGEAKIVDFGLAKAAGQQALTKSGTTLGTPYYMSPEQATSRDVDGRSDIWSLGAVLYEMVTGIRPFVGDSEPAVVRAILDDDPRSLDELRPDIPPGLRQIIGRMLEKEPDQRYPSAAELLTELRALDAELQGRELEATQETPTPRPPVRARLRPAPAVLTAMLIIAVAVVGWLLRETGGGDGAPAAPPRIVVLPFSNLGPPEDAYFAAGMTEELTTRLAAVSGLEVISRTSAMHYRDTDKTIGQIGAELDVAYVIEGTVRWDRAGGGSGRVRITPQLIGVEDDSSLWTASYDRVLEDIFAVQSDIAERITDELNITLLGSEQRALQARATDNLEAYQAYLRALDHSFSWEQQDLEIAQRMAERAVALDPRFALAHALLSEIHSISYHFYFDRSTDRLEHARAAADRALALDPELPEAHRALGYYHYWGHNDYGPALEAFRQAIAGRPSDSLALSGIAAIQRRQGQWDESIAAFERVVELNPQDVVLTTVGLATSYRMMRRYEDAERIYEKAIAMAPDKYYPYFERSVNYRLWNGDTARARRLLQDMPMKEAEQELFCFALEMHDRDWQAAIRRLEGTPEIFAEGMEGEFYTTSLARCRVFDGMGDAVRAEAACRQALAFLEARTEASPDDAYTRNALGWTHALLGDNQAAIREAERAVELAPLSHDAVSGTDHLIRLAKIYARAGEHDGAIDTIEQLLAIPANLSVPLLRLDPDWDPLRDHPRFQQLAGHRPAD